MSESLLTSLKGSLINGLSSHEDMNPIKKGGKENKSRRNWKSRYYILRPSQKTWWKRKKGKKIQLREKDCTLNFSSATIYSIFLLSFSLSLFLSPIVSSWFHLKQQAFLSPPQSQLPPCPLMTFCIKYNDGQRQLYQSLRYFNFLEEGQTEGQKRREWES